MWCHCGVTQRYYYVQYMSGMGVFVDVDLEYQYRYVLVGSSAVRDVDLEYRYRYVQLLLKDSMSRMLRILRVSLGFLVVPIEYYIILKVIWRNIISF